MTPTLPGTYPPDSGERPTLPPSAAEREQLSLFERKCQSAGEWVARLRNLAEQLSSNGREYGH